MYSFKISSHVSFPLEGLDMRPFLAKESPSQVTTYDLLSVICHHGTAGSTRHFISWGCFSLHLSQMYTSSLYHFSLICMCCFSHTAGGHYTAYCQNVINGQWYEFDDQYVSEVHETVVQNAEAYVLFYRWECEDPEVSMSRTRVCTDLQFMCLGLAQEKQRGVGESEAEGGGSGQPEGAQPAAVLHLQRVAQQVQHICRTRAHQQPHVPLPARR